MIVLPLHGVGSILRSGRVGIGILIGGLIIGTGTGVGKGRVTDIDGAIGISFQFNIERTYGIDSEESSSRHYIPCNSYL